VNRRITVLFLAAAAYVCAGGRATGQHATAFDVEDGARVYEQICANCHGPDGNLIAGIDLGRGQFRRPLTDSELAAIIMNGIPNTAMPPSPSVTEEQVETIVAFLRANAEVDETPRLAGDASRGRALFEGPGECRDCHAIDGRGSRVGPDLSAIGRMRRAVELEQSLLEPAAEVQPNNRFYRVVTGTGEEVVGRLLNHDTYSVQLLDSDERLRSFRKADLREQGFDDTPMPSYRDKLDEQEIADLISYLVSRGTP
jgi:putative heme-binding domain-containing protein